MILMEDLFHTSGGIFAEQLLVIYQPRHITTHIGPSPVLSSLKSTNKTNKNNNNTITIIIKVKTPRDVEHAAKKRMSPSHIVHALCFFVMVAGLCGHSVHFLKHLSFIFFLFA
jgi:hypothetical protein